MDSVEAERSSASAKSVWTIGNVSSHTRSRGLHLILNYVNNRKDPSLITKEPTKPTRPITWHTEEGQRGRLVEVFPSHIFSSLIDSSVISSVVQNSVESKLTREARESGENESIDQGNNISICGKEAAKINGQAATCNPDSSQPCCGNGFYCGSGKEYCECEGCVDYRK